MTLADAARAHGLGQVKAAPDRPSVKIDPATGEGTAEAVVRRTDEFDALLAKMLPDVPVDVLEVTEVRAWGHPDDPYQYVKARVRRRLDGGKTGRELLRAIPRRRARKATADVAGERTLVVNFSDVQVGKATEDGGGTEETIARVRSVAGQLPDRVASMKRMGRSISRIVVANLGDMGEGTCQNYSAQPFRIDLNESDQMAVAMDLLDDLVDVCAGLVPEVICTVVNSNHDRPRDGGKYVTDESDSRAFTVHRALARAYAKNPERYGHVTWHIPEDPLVSTLDLHGVGVAFIHGHEATRGATPQAKVWNWWGGQLEGRLPAGNCSVLLSGHFHHFAVLEQQGRTMLMSPSLDGGSRWLRNVSGVWSDPGMLVCTVDSDGVDDIKVLRP